MFNLGILGGTFDPVHYGHLQLAESVLKERQLDRIVFIPAGCPPHKDRVLVGDADHRLKMLELAIEPYPGFSLSTIEYERKKTSFTVTTLRYLNELLGTGIQLHFIIGFDAFLEIKTWYCWQEVLKRTNFIVGDRPGISRADIEILLKENDFIPQTTDLQNWQHTATGCFVSFHNKEIIDISSSEIRNRIALKKAWRQFVPDTVAAYITEHHLYI